MLKPGQPILTRFIATPVYRATFVFMLRELNRLFRARFLKILVLSFVAAGAQVAALVMIINTVNVLASGGEVDRYGIHVTLEPSLSSVISLATLVVALIATATFAMYRSRAQIARLMIDYHNNLERGVFRGVAKLVRQPLGSPGIKLLNPVELNSMIGKDGRFAGRVINEVASSAFPVAAVTIIVPILLYLDWLLFSVLAVIMVGSLAVYGWVGRKGAAVSVALEQRGPMASRSKMAVLRTIRTAAPPPEEVDGLVAQLRSDPNVGNFEEAYANRLTMPHLGNAVGSVFLALTSFVVLVYFGTRILDGSWDQASGFLFVLLFVYVLISIRNLGRSLTNMNIFYPHLRRIVHFILETEKISVPVGPTEASPAGEAAAAVAEHLGVLWGYIPSTKSPDFQHVREELAAGLEQFVGITKDEADALLSELAIAPLSLDFWVAKLYMDMLLQHPGLIDRFEQEYPNKARLGELMKFIERTETEGVSEKLWGALTQESQGVLATIALTCEPYPIVVLPVTYLSALGAEEQNYLQESYPGVIVAYWQKNTSSFNSLGVGMVMNFTTEMPQWEPAGKQPKPAKAKKQPKSAPQDHIEDDLFNEETY